MGVGSQMFCVGASGLVQTVVASILGDVDVGPMRARTSVNQWGAVMAVGWLWLGTGCAQLPSTREPMNLTLAKTAVSTYVDSGAYAEDVAMRAREVESWLIARVARASAGERLGIVFDIDETVLSNERHMRSRDYGYWPADWSAWVASAQAPALTPVRDAYRRALALGVAVYFITGRPEADRAGTVANLRREGMGEFGDLIMSQPSAEKRTSAEKKTAARAAIEQKGVRLIANVGDQESDLVGGYAERTFKLPGPFYQVP